VGNPTVDEVANYRLKHPDHCRDEHKAVKRYLSKYKIENKSRWYRETIISHILKTLEEDYPTLFRENEMRR
jgi:hypothetical protein